MLEIFPYRWELVGQPAPVMAFGKLGGTASIQAALDARGISATEGQISDMVLRMKDLAIEQKAEVTEVQLEGIIQAVLNPPAQAS